MPDPTLFRDSIAKLKSNFQLYSVKVTFEKYQRAFGFQWINFYTLFLFMVIFVLFTNPLHHLYFCVMSNSPPPNAIQSFHCSSTPEIINSKFLTIYAQNFYFTQIFFTGLLQYSSYWFLFQMITLYSKKVVSNVQSSHYLQDLGEVIIGSVTPFSFRLISGFESSTSQFWWKAHRTLHIQCF